MTPWDVAADLYQDSKEFANFLETSPIFTILVYTSPIRREYQAILNEYSRRHKTPVVSIHSAGFYSYFQISLPGAFPIVETHPDETSTTDLRLLSPLLASVALHAPPRLSVSHSLRSAVV